MELNDVLLEIKEFSLQPANGIAGAPEKSCLLP
jgi:hypothetical protein